MTEDNRITQASLAEIVYRVNALHYENYNKQAETAEAILAAGWKPPTLKAAIADFLNRALLIEPWENTSEEAAAVVMNLIAEHGWREPETEATS